ncbi:MAG TPA: hydroxymethylbilane synthase [Kofleriaceae bacterium]|nr:hydroxymethylbilane synthase [Kofleriaceae bacterium]
MKITIATRGSALALWQAEHVKARLLAVDPALEVDLLKIKTSGDQILDVPLAQVGGKGLFVKEIEEALLRNDADLAVHSMKDVPAELAPGLVLAATSTREDPHDALCCRPGTWRSLDELPHGARVGTSSLRRQCQLLARRPDLQIQMLRGNVPTRLRKLDEDEFDAIVLAAAGLTRLGLADRITQKLPADVCLPAVAQGVLGIETRAGDERTIALARAAIHDDDEAPRTIAERAFLARMGGSCQTPLAAHAYAGDRLMIVDAICGTPDGTRILRARVQGPPEHGEQLGRSAAEQLLEQGAAEIVAACTRT